MQRYNRFPIAATGRHLFRAAFFVAFVLVTGAAHAVCPGLDVLLEDDFEVLRSVWGEEGPEIRIEDGALLVGPASGTDFWRVNTSGVYDDLDMCVTLTTVAGVEPTESKAGAIFWYEDVNNFYVFQYAPNGRASVWRRQRGLWLEQVAWKDADGANPGDGGVNELRVTATGTTAEFFVNGSLFGEIEGEPPDIGQQIGVFASSPTSGRAIFSFDELRVTSP